MPACSGAHQGLTAGDRIGAARRGLAALIREHMQWQDVPAGSPPPPGEDLGSVTFEVQRQTRPSRRWQALTRQWESCLEHSDERPGRSAARGGPESGRVQSMDHQPDGWSAFAGVDWCGEHHQLCIAGAAGRRLSQLRVAHDVAGLADLDAELARFAARMPIAIERSEGLLVEHLQATGHAVFPLSPPRCFSSRRSVQR